MKIGLYQDLRGNGIGGGEYCLAVIAQLLLTEGHSVDVVHHQSSGFTSRLSDFFQMDLSQANERCFPIPNRWDAPDAPALSRGKAMKGWMKDASAPYDVFICITHDTPPFNFAPVGILYVLFPFFDRTSCWPWNRASLTFSGLKQIAARQLYEKWWRERFESYSRIVSISEFTRKWTNRYWGRRSLIQFPPVDTENFTCSRKEELITVLGRITPVKKQAELALVFEQYRHKLPEWRFQCIGGFSGSEEDKTYCEYLYSVSKERSTIALNATRERVKLELARSKVFWHAMGLDTDENLQPHRIEHFGIATVEAMASGCIPVVIDRGGQREIVTNGETGFLCSSWDEFADRTIELSRDPLKTDRMSRAAKDHSRHFAKAAFGVNFLRLLNEASGGTNPIKGCDRRSAGLFCEHKQSV